MNDAQKPQKSSKARIYQPLTCTTGAPTHCRAPNAPDGCPVAIEVFSGNTADPTTFTAQVNKVRKRFGLTRVVLVGDRGMITSKRIDEDLREVDGLDWITALHNGGIKKLVEQKMIQLSFFDEKDLAMPCKNRARWNSSPNVEFDRAEPKSMG